MEMVNTPGQMARADGKSPVRVTLLAKRWRLPLKRLQLFAAEGRLKCVTLVSDPDQRLVPAGPNSHLWYFHLSPKSPSPDRWMKIRANKIHNALSAGSPTMKNDFIEGYLHKDKLRLDMMYVEPAEIMRFERAEKGLIPGPKSPDEWVLSVTGRSIQRDGLSHVLNGRQFETIQLLAWAKDGAGTHTWVTYDRIREVTGAAPKSRITESFRGPKMKALLDLLVARTLTKNGSARLKVSVSIQ